MIQNLQPAMEADQDLPICFYYSVYFVGHSKKEFNVAVQDVYAELRETCYNIQLSRIT